MPDTIILLPTANTDDNGEKGKHRNGYNDPPVDHIELLGE
jgi:hypothetical protein